MKNALLIAIIFFCMFQLFIPCLNAQLTFNELSSNIGSKSYNCAVADFNNDGYMDVYLVNFSSHDKLWLQNPDNSFSESNQDIGNSVKFNRTIGIADLNGDNYPDLFIPNDANWNSTTISYGLPNEIWFNDGKGKFTDSGQRLGNSASTDVALGDIDGDGDIDAVIANFHNTNLDNLEYQSNVIWINNGNGTFSKDSIDLGIGCNQVQLTDVDNDNDQDIIFSSEGTNKGTSIYLNNGTGNFSKLQNTIKSCSAFDTGDIDNDGDIDLIIANAVRNSSSKVELWLNNGVGLFEYNKSLNEGINGADIKLVDFDGDKDLDIIATNGIWKSAAPVIWINQGNAQNGEVGDFSIFNTNLGNFQLGKIAIADFNNDTIPDFLISNYSGNNKIFLTTNQTSTIQTMNNSNTFIYPTIANDFITVDGIYRSNYSFKIIDISGNIVKQGKLTSNILNVNMLPAGNYFLIIDNLPGQKFFKL